MRIKCWGSRGSISVSGKEYIKYGGDTTCLEIRTKDDQIIIIDAGTGIRRLGNNLISEGRYSYNIIFTHAHWDHLMGFPFFKPIYLKKADIRIQSCPFGKKFVDTMLNKVMSPPSFPVKYADIKAYVDQRPECPEHMEIGTVTIIPIRISHPNQGNGYKFIEDDKTFVFIPDNELDFIHRGGLSFDEYIKFSAGADLLIHDAEYTEEEYRHVRKWGHSIYKTALELAIEAGVKQLGLFHLNQDRTDEDVDQMINTCEEIITTKGSNLKCSAVGCDTTFDL